MMKTFFYNAIRFAFVFTAVALLPVYGTQYTVSTPAQITSRMSTAQPGDTLRMSNGVWSNASISFAGYGTASLPIVLRADTYGSVILSGTSSLSISGKNLVVDGLVFQNGYVTNSPVISFQGVNGVSDSCRLTNCSIISYNPSDLTSDIDWVGLYGSHNRIDHCYFYNKANKGCVIVVWCDTTKSDYHQIDHNNFNTRVPVSDGSGGYLNGLETIRVGTGAYSTTNSYTVIEQNYFYKCDGDAEVISNKSNGNTYRYNTLKSCQGMLSMRQGNNCTIQGNFILGNHATGYRGTGGIRITGSNHVVFNNYVSGVDNNKAGAALSLMDGTAVGVSPSYPTAKNAIVAYNTFVDNTFSIALGVNNNGGTIFPDSCTFANNVTYTTINNPLISVYDTPTNLTWQGNIFYGGSTLGITKPAGITQTNPKMSLASDTLYRPSSSSPVIGAAASIASYSYVTDDMDGQARDASPDVGADEYSAATITRRPLTPTDVGPGYLATVQPTTQASSIVISGVTATSAIIRCTAGNGTQRIIVVHAGSAVSSDPTDFVTYTANSAFGSGTQIGTGNYVIYSGSGTVDTITGLSSATTYYVNVYEYNGSNGTENYLTTNPATSNWTTLTVEPTVQASAVSFSSVTSTSLTVSCTAGNGAQRIILMRSGGAVSSTPADNVTYTANSAFGSGTQVGTGNYVIYKGSGTSVSVTGLSAGTTYYVSVCEFNGSGGSENYLITSPATGNTTTLVTEPTVQASSVAFSSVTASSLTLSCTKGNGVQRIILMHAWSAVSSNPVDNTSYTANSIFGSGTQIGAVNYVVYKDTGSSVTITGLTANTAYYVKVYEFNGGTGSENYLTTSPASNSATTLPNTIHTNGAGGNWSSTGTWSGGVVPGLNDNAIIDSGATVALDADASVFGLTVSSGGALTVSTTRTLNTNVSVYGAFTGSGTITITVSGNITCSGTSASFKLSSANTIVSGTSGKTFTLSNGATFQTSNNTSPFAGSMANFTWVIDNSASLTNIIIKNSGVTSILNPPNSQTIGNLQLTCAGSSNNKIFSLGENISILGDLLIADGNTVTSPTNYTTWNLGAFSITTSGTGKAVSVTQAAANTVLLIKGTGSSLFNGFSSCNFIPPANANCTVTYAGTAQTIAGGQYQNLADSSGGAKTLGGDISVSGTLTLANGTISLGSYNLSLSGSVSGTLSASNMIIASGTGELRKTFSTVPSAFTFPVGTGNTYSPVKLTLTSGALSSAYIGIKVNGSKSSYNSSSTNYLNRFWTLTSSGITNPVYTDTLYYAVSDVSGSESALTGGLYTGSLWITTGAANVTGHFITGSALNTFGTITAGEASAFANSGQVQVSVIPQGFYNSAGYLNCTDTIRLCLANISQPYNIIDSTNALLDSLTFTATGTFRNSQNGNYYLVVKHRNSVETWSAAAISFANGSLATYNFTDAQSKAYGDNQVQISTDPVRWAIYSGDVNQDGYVDPLDLSLIDQDSFTYTSGLFLRTDLNGDSYVDPLDLSIADQNSFMYIGVQKPTTNKTIRKIRK